MGIETHISHLQLLVKNKMAVPYQSREGFRCNRRSFSIFIGPLMSSTTFFVTTLLPFTIQLQVVTSLNFPIPWLTYGTCVSEAQGLNFDPRDMKVENPVSMMGVTLKKGEEALLD